MDRRLLFCLWLAVAGTGLARAEIVKCIDPQGHVTLTDLPCGNGTVVPITPPAAPPPAAAEPWPDSAAPAAAPFDLLRAGPVRIHLSPAEFGPRHPAYHAMTRPAPSQILSVDASTLRAARSMLTLRSAQHELASR